MTAREVLKKACKKGETAPYQPLCFITTALTVKMMEHAGVFLPDAHLDPEKMAVLGSMAYEMYGAPCLKIPFDATVEAGAFGATVTYGNNEIFPQVRASGYLDDADRLVLPSDTADAGRVPVVLEAIRILRRRYPKLPVIVHTMGPFATMSLLFGFGRMLEWMMDEDPNYAKAMEKTTEFSKSYSRLIEEAGADIILYGEAAASCEVIGAGSYDRWAAPYHKELSDRLSIPVVLHMCGDITPCVAGLPENTGMDGISYDFKVKNTYAKEALRGKMKAVGNLDPIGRLLNGTPDTVREAVHAALRDGVDVLAAGCTLPPKMPEENLRAMIEAHREYLEEKGIRPAETQ